MLPHTFPPPETLFKDDLFSVNDIIGKPINV